MEGSDRVFPRERDGESDISIGSIDRHLPTVICTMCCSKRENGWENGIMFFYQPPEQLPVSTELQAPAITFPESSETRQVEGDARM